MSPQINELAAALCNLQSELKPAVKDSSNPYFKSKYADLNSIWDSCRALLHKNGLSVTQTMDARDGNCSSLSTTLLHTSGQWVAGEQPLNPVRDDPQGIGSAITYARRYGLAAILGIVADEDDDGNAASHTKRKTGVIEVDDPRKESIAKKILALGFDPKSKTEWGNVVKSLTDLNLVEGNYDAILDRLDVRLNEKN